MKNRDTNLLAEAYEISYYRNLLLKEGYTLEEANYLIEQGFINKVKRFGRNAALGAVAAGTMLGSAPKAQATSTIPSTPPAITQTAQHSNPLITAGQQAKAAYFQAAKAHNPDIFTSAQQTILNQVASQLHIQPNQVQQHLQNIYNSNSTAYADLTFLLSNGDELYSMSGAANNAAAPVIQNALNNK